MGDNGKYKFDANGNLTITHTYNGESYSENYTFFYSNAQAFFILLSPFCAQSIFPVRSQQ